MTCRRCKGKGETYGQHFISEGEFEEGFDRCDPCHGTGEAICECEAPADGYSMLTSRPTCATCLGREAMEIDRALATRTTLRGD